MSEDELKEIYKKIEKMFPSSKKESLVVLQRIAGQFQEISKSTYSQSRLAEVQARVNQINKCMEYLGNTKEQFHKDAYEKIKEEYDIRRSYVESLRDELKVYEMVIHTRAAFLRPKGKHVGFWVDINRRLLSPNMLRILSFTGERIGKKVKIMGGYFSPDETILLVSYDLESVVFCINEKE